MGVVLKDGALVMSQGFFHGYTPFVWLIAAMQVTLTIRKKGFLKMNFFKKKGCRWNSSGRNDEIRRQHFEIIRHGQFDCFVFCLFLLFIKGRGYDNVTPTFLIGTIVIIVATFLYSVQTVATSSTADPSLPLLYPSTSDVLEECRPVKIIEHK